MMMMNQWLMTPISIIVSTVIIMLMLMLTTTSRCPNLRLD